MDISSHKESQKGVVFLLCRGMYIKARSFLSKRVIIVEYLFYNGMNTNSIFR